jgi:Zn-finger nucleic acid-binding protein
VFRLPDPPSGAAGLACPHCGAPCSPARVQCEHCGSTLATVRCPRCFGLLFQGAKHCAHCGAPAQVPARAADAGETEPLACPRCSRPLVAHLTGDTLIDQCDGCGGLWIDQAAFDSLLARREQESAAAGALGSPRSGPTAVNVAAGVVYLKCPECRQVMSRRNFARRSGVIVDVCHAHGLWFDRDELPKVLDFVRGGGLAEARRQEVAELEDQLRNARDAQARIKDASGPLFAPGEPHDFKLADFVFRLFR